MPQNFRIAPGIRGTRLFSVLKYLYRTHKDTGVRQLALGAMQDPTYVGLGALHDYLDENGHEEGQRFNFRGAMGKLETDKKVRAAIDDILDGWEIFGVTRRGHREAWAKALADSALAGVPKGAVIIPRDIQAIKTAAKQAGLSATEYKQTLRRIGYNADTQANLHAGYGGYGLGLKARKSIEESTAQQSLMDTKGMGPGMKKELKAVNYSRSSLPSALRRLRSQQQQGLRKVAARIHEQLGLTPAKVRSALLDSDKLTRNDTAQVLYHEDDQDRIRYAAAWYGHLTQAPALALFHVSDGGPDSLYHFRYEGEAEDLRRSLTAAGVTQRVLIPAKQGWSALVLDPGRGLRKPLAEALQQLGINDIEESEGRAEVLGKGSSKATAAGRRAYRDVIQTYEKEHG